MSDKALDQTLLQVRQSYRLLYAYHERIRSTVNLISSQFPKMHFYQWHAEVSQPRSQTDIHQPRWIWDAFPQHTYSVLFTLSSERLLPAAKAGDYILEIRVISDDSIFSQPSPNGNTGPAPNVKSAETSDTRIEIYIWKCEKSDELNSDSLVDIWYEVDYPTEEFKKIAVDYQNDEYSVFKKSVSMANLATYAKTTEIIEKIKQKAGEELELKF